MELPLSQVLLLVGAAFLAGAQNAVAGGGSFLTVPALLLVGVAPVPANATSTVALWPGALASLWAYRRELAASRREALSLAAISALGGVAGALLLVGTPGELFLRLLPFLLLTATLLFTFGQRLTAALRARVGARGHHLAALALQALIAVYGGYFGGGMGLMMLAGLTLLGLTDIHRMNALKVLLGVLINGLAVATFFLAHLVHLPVAATMVLGAVAGGWAGATGARRLPASWVRRFVILLGWTMTALFFLRALRAS